jgi:hypothetical protein
LQVRASYISLVAAVESGFAVDRKRSIDHVWQFWSLSGRGPEPEDDLLDQDYKRCDYDH